MRMRERVLNRGIPAPRDTLLLQVSQKRKRSSMFFLGFRVRCHAHESPSRLQKSDGRLPSIPSTPQAVIEARKPPVGWPCRLHRTRGAGALGRVAGAGGLVLPPNRRGAFVAQRARDVGQKKTVVDVDGDSSARRGAQRSPWRPQETERPTPSTPCLPRGVDGMKKPYIAREKGKMSAQRRTSVKTLTIATTHTNLSWNQGDWAGRKRGPIHTTLASVENRLLDRVWTFFGPRGGVIVEEVIATCGRNLRSV
jgi:hypothetical protein